MNDIGRPNIHIEPTPQDKTVEAVALVGMVVLCLLPLFFYSQLSEQIPTHFNAAGEPDSFGDKNNIWIVPGLGLAIYILFTKFNRNPSSFNYPIKITAENAAFQYKKATQMLRWVKLAVILLSIYLESMMISVGMGVRSGLPSWFVWFFVAGILAPIVYFGFLKKE